MGSFTFADKILDTIDDVRRGINGWLKADHTQYFPIATAHNKNVLALNNGSLLSVIRIHGYMGQYTRHQFHELRHEWARFAQTNANDKSASGFDLFWSYEYDPEGMEDYTLAAKQQQIIAAARRGMRIADICEEDAKIYGQSCARETQLLMVVTHVDSLPKADRKRAYSAAVEDRKTQVKAIGSARRGIGLRALDAIHEQQVNKVLTFLESAKFGYDADRLDSYASLWAMRHSLIPSTTSKAWKAKLRPADMRLRPTDEVTEYSRKNTTKDKAAPDWTALMPPRISDQLVPDHVFDLGSYVVVQDRIYAPLYVTELATDPEPIDIVLRMFYQRRLPVRIVFSLQSNHAQANYWNRLFAGVFSFMSTSNRQISTADNAQKAYVEGNGALYGYGISVTTWSKVEQFFDKETGRQLISTAEIQRRAHDVETLLQQWGGQQLSSVFGCSVEAAFSASPGYMMPPQAPLAPQVEYDVLTQLPLMRPATLWRPENAIWTRTEDGVLMPFQPMSSRQSSMIQIIMGGMGFGKSNWIAEHINYFATSPEFKEMPYIRGMDFGASSSGVIDMIRSSLAEGQKHEAMFEYFSNNGDMVKCLGDTRLQCRYPLADHKNFLVNFFLIVCGDELIESAGLQNILTLLDVGINRAYERRDPRIADSDVPVYRESIAAPEVRECIEKHGLQLDEDSNYWEVVDALIEVGLREGDQSAMRAAKIAQRDCSPLLRDFIVGITEMEPQFKDVPTINGVSFVKAVTAAIANANRLFPCFAGKTNIDISESRVCVFDMSRVFGRDTGPGADWRRSAFFAAAMRLLTEDLFISLNETGQELTLSQSEMGITDATLAWHLRYLERQDQIKKVFWADEIHRIGVIKGAFNLLDSMTFEARKYVVGLLLGTQMPHMFPENVLSLATSILIFGANQSSKIAENMQKLFDLTDDERQIVESITKPNAMKGAEVFAIHRVDKRVQRLKLHFVIGGIKRWAYATEGNERELRRILYERGPSTDWARKVLAQRVPSLTAELARRKEKSDELVEIDLINDIADELLSMHIGND
ncbi:TPA: hypothetical protein L5S55_005296 [Pseudomonas aeruginosa]|uniref:hypothetical protein n=1 Tax=Pseudomonas aeruginosa TaxID=287 RepID=UPI00093DD2C6|nr:hypothetical protein [Pseudomonas aeruginosa]HBP1166033.1 hypothetical protein [Pseudomonas aeruginosa]